MGMMLATIALLGTAPARPPLWAPAVLLSIIVCLVVFGPCGFGFWPIRFRNRKVVKLLKRYVKYISWKHSRDLPEWMHQELVWDGIDGDRIVMRKYRTVLGKREFIGTEFIRPRGLDSEDEVSILIGIMSKEGTDSPEEFDLWLSQKGF